MEAMEGEFDYLYGAGAPSTRHRRGRARFQRMVVEQIDACMAAGDGSVERSNINASLRAPLRPGRFKRRGDDGVWSYGRW